MTRLALKLSPKLPDNIHAKRIPRRVRISVMRMGRWLRLRTWIRDLDPGYFALVMATGIVSAAVRLDGAGRLAVVLLAAAVVCYLILVVAYGWRLACYRGQFLADAADPRRGFAFFTFVAGSNVLAAELAGDGHRAPAAVLLAAGGACWVLLCYTLPPLLAGRAGALAGVNGTWFLWVVGPSRSRSPPRRWHGRCRPRWPCSPWAPGRSVSFST
jgi:Voltage-dependent anion channel